MNMDQCVDQCLTTPPRLDHLIEKETHCEETLKVPGVDTFAVSASEPVPELLPNFGQSYKVP